MSARMMCQVVSFFERRWWTRARPIPEQAPVIRAVFVQDEGGMVEKMERKLMEGGMRMICTVAYSAFFTPQCELPHTTAPIAGSSADPLGSFYDCTAPCDVLDVLILLR
jgi:hypothetical protein